MLHLYKEMLLQYLEMQEYERCRAAITTAHQGKFHVITWMSMSTQVLFLGLFFTFALIWLYLNFWQMKLAKLKSETVI